MKGQTQVISVLLVVGITLALVATITPWSISMIQKRKDAKAVDDVFNFFFLLDSKIREVAVSGGEQTLNLNVPGKLIIYPDGLVGENSNSINFMFTSKVSNVALNDWIAFTPNTNQTATLGTDPFGVIMAKAVKKRDFMEIQYKVWYRDLIDRSNGNKYRIKITTSGNQILESTTGYIRIQRGETTTSQSLTTTEIKIII
ncbi:MAG: hypothetical protein QXM68_02665 [Candidatus Aenigmatarchaeota archaeon]|nr:hypothetical protein [Candidatus Aenigmarchaeota archaeon]